MLNGGLTVKVWLRHIGVITIFKKLLAGGQIWFAKGDIKHTEPIPILYPVWVIFLKFSSNKVLTKMAIACSV